MKSFASYLAEKNNLIKNPDSSLASTGDYEKFVFHGSGKNSDEDDDKKKKKKDEKNVEINPEHNVVAEGIVPLAKVQQTASLDIRNEDDRAVVNNILDFETRHKFITPYVAWGRASKVLSFISLHLPQVTDLTGTDGVKVMKLHQFGYKAGMTNDAQFKVNGEVPKDHSKDRFPAGHHSHEVDIDIEPQNPETPLEKSEIEDEEDFYFYFEYEIDGEGMYLVFAAICDETDLKELEAEVGGDIDEIDDPVEE